VKRLVSLALGAEGEAAERIAESILVELPRSELKQFLSALRREARRRSVALAVEGDAGGVAEAAVRRGYPDQHVEVAREQALGAGLRISAGDDIVDASMRGYIAEIIEALGGT
jgi:hypothetical protein